MNRKYLLTPQQMEYARSLFRDPVLFARRVLGVNLWGREVEILRSVETHRRTAIKAAHGLGKTFTLAVISLWWLARHHEGIVLTTSPTLRQVKTQLWAEIHRLVAHAKIPYPDLNQTELKLRGEDNFALGFSTNQGERFQGFHGKAVLMIIDEAPGIDASIWDPIAGTMAGGKVHMIMAGNPTVPSGAYYDAFTRDRALWNCITIDAFDSPNLQGLSLEQLLDMDPTDGGPLDQNPVPYLVTRRWVYEQFKVWWHGDESSSPSWMARVRGQFPDQAQNALIKLLWLERARLRTLQHTDKSSGTSLVAGVDVGAGQSETVVYLCESKPHHHRIITFGAWRGADTRGEVVRFLQPYRERLSSVRVDAIGIGYGFGHHLREQRFPVELINVAQACASQPGLGENDPAKRFANEKAHFYQVLADALEHDQLDGLSDETTIGQLAGILYEIDSRGRVRIEPKEKARERGILSPDRAEALMLALCKPRQIFEFYGVDDLPRLNARVGICPFDDDANGRVRRRRWLRGLEDY